MCSSVVRPQRAVDFPLGVPFGHGVALVVQVLAYAHAQVQLHAAVLQIHVQRHQCVALALHRAAQLADLTLVEQKTLGPQRVGVEDVALLIGADVHALNEDFPVLDHSEALFQVHLALAHGLDFRAFQLDAALDAFLDEVIVACLCGSAQPA